ncbi:hypothetical protein PN462_13450 [Spirulina sp. CS-785/01]|uniref:hypothetical protein n=1 Tax=Spirulina sp. CS-785/01 TaxID=3021716 RepID=UPI00232BB6C8|nr:hypothetical protein [Spirulina sp. CS-785/01]MDB9314111.1 hypothetical protein [Spirulina sp. CS-785/01]
MTQIYHLKASELDGDFLEMLKAKFGDKSIKIIISEEDETDYLLQSPENKQRLLQAIHNIENRENLVEINLDEWE